MSQHQIEAPTGRKCCAAVSWHVGFTKVNLFDFSWWILVAYHNIFKAVMFSSEFSVYIFLVGWSSKDEVFGL